MDPRIRFLLALTNLVKQGVIKNKGQAIAFAKRQFEKIDELFDRQIGNIFKKGTPSKSKIGEFFGFKNYPKTAQKKKGEVVPFKKKIDLSKYDDAALNALVAEDKKLLAEANKLSEAGVNYGRVQEIEARRREIQEILKAAQDVPASGIGSFKADMELAKISEDAKKIVAKRTKDIVKGDPTGEVSEIMEGLASIKQGGKGLDPREGVIRAAAREILNKNKIKIGKEDPIELLRKTYGEAGLDALDAIGDDLLNTQTYGEMNDLLTKNKLFNLKAKKVPGYDKSVQDAEELRILDEFDIDPDRKPNADGGIAGQLHLNRTGFRVGSGVKIYNLVTKYGPEFKKFAEALFIKASNMIRQGKGMWKGLSEKQRIVQHDNLVKKIKTFEEKGTLEDMDQYFGVDAEKAFIEARAKVQKQSTADEITKGIADVMQDTSEAGLARSIEVDNLKLEFPGISDEMIENILTDTNPQRIAEVKATMKEALKMQEKGMGPDEIIQMFKKTPRTKQAHGGLINILKL